MKAMLAICILLVAGMAGQGNRHPFVHGSFGWGLDTGPLV